MGTLYENIQRQLNLEKMSLDKGLGHLVFVVL